MRQALRVRVQEEMQQRARQQRWERLAAGRQDADSLDCEEWRIEECEVERRVDEYMAQLDLLSQEEALVDELTRQAFEEPRAIILALAE